MPVLGGVTDAKHLYLVPEDFIDRYVGPRREDELAGIFGPPNAATIGHLSK
jgi:hypothetical protein